MNTIFYYLFSIIMISRLIFQFKDDPISEKDTIKKSLFEIFALLLISSFNLSLLWLVITIIFLNAVTYFFDNKGGANLFIYRFLVLMLYCFTFSIFFSEKANLITHNQFISTIKHFLEEHNILVFIIKKITWKYCLVFLSGTLMVANEVNHIVRFVLSKLKVEPQKGGESKDMDTIELKRGRIIGIIERVLIYYFVIEGNLTSIGFILAAKSFTRFKELEDKNFAEYVLIGTLLSAFLAIAVGISVKKALL